MADNPRGGTHRGKTTSWVAVTVMLLGFLIGGIGLVAGPWWMLFFIGVGVFAVGASFALSIGIFDDVVMDERQEIRRPDSTPVGTDQHELPPD